MDRTTAIDIVLNYLNSSCSSPEDRIVILNDVTVIRPYGWVFFYQSQRFLESQNESHALLGNGPIVLLRESSEIFELGTALPFEDSLKEFETNNEL